MYVTIKQKLISGFSILIGLIVIISLLALIKLNEISYASHLTITRSLIVNYTNQIEIAVFECRRAEKNFWMRKEDKYVDRLNRQVKNIKYYINLIKDRTQEKDINSSMDTVNTLVDEYYEAFISSAALFKAGQMKDKILTEDNRFVILARQLQDISHKIAAEARKKMEKEIELTQKTTARVMKMIVIEIIMAVIIGFLMSFFISRSITKSIDNLMHTIKRIRDGDIGARIEIKSQNELGILGDYFNKMLEEIEQAKDEQLILHQQVARAEKLVSLGRLAAGISHEINNPLTGILTSAHLLLKKIPECENKREVAPLVEDLEIIVRETTRCREIIKRVLNFARQTKPEMMSSNINEIIRRCLSLIKHQLLFHNVKIIRNLTQSLPLVLADAQQIQQVFINIILNAQEAMPDGGILTISSHTCDDFVEVKITDTGCGIPQEDMDKLFAPFFTTKDEGTGLGLAVSYGIIERHQGSIEVKSKLGHGTTVMVKLPILSDV